MKSAEHTKYFVGKKQSFCRNIVFFDWTFFCWISEAFGSDNHCDIWLNWMTWLESCEQVL